MLTREQLHAECRKIFDALPDRGETIDGVDDAVLKLNKQAAMAIDLEAENERLYAERAELFGYIGDEPNRAGANIADIFAENEQMKLEIASMTDREMENKSLQSKLDKIREWVDFWAPDIRDISHVGHDTILSILDEKGEGE